MKILYGINTNGQGHINRARAVISQMIRDGHQVDSIFSGPKPPQYAYNMSCRTKRMAGWISVFDDKKMNLTLTALANFERAVRIPKKMKRLFNLINDEEYDCIITDFDPFTSLTGKFLDIPTISIDHQHSMIHPGAIMAPGKPVQRATVEIVVRLTIPHRDYYYAIDYVDKPDIRENGILHPLIWKSDFNDYKPSVEDHYTVYLNKISSQEIVDVLSKFPDETFNVYGHEIDKSVNNIYFKKTSRNGFIRDFCSAKGIITHGGFSISWEAIMVNKPILAIPQQEQYEQYTNAYRIVKHKVGLAGKELTPKNVKKYLNFCENHDFVVENGIPVLPAKTFTKNLYTRVKMIQNNQ